MDESVIERGVNVCNTEDKLSLSNLRTERNGVIFFGDLGFLRSLCIQKVSLQSTSITSQNCETMLKLMAYNTTGRCTESYTHHFDGLEVYSAIWALESMDPKQGFAAVERIAQT
jgi:hypothetical protein